ncbi:GNAT family N-acetyltransferase [Pleurocapsales cyanobacterium LEGE 10410]|nr:GNAT family N-acetyltransferase [Pleurocapsales cyanobacterium LEGE 10410]
MLIRLFRSEDTAQIAQLFQDTVRQVNIRDYSKEQVTAWSPDNIYFRDWSKICSSRFTYVAEQNGKIIGFGELEASGHIDCFYVHYQYQRQGVGRKIYRAIENKAWELNLISLFTEASITAKPFFASRGFVVKEQQKVSCRGQTFTNYAMEKLLTTELP